MRILKGNPLHAAIERIKVAAQRFENWRQTDESLVATLLNKPYLLDAARHIARVPPPLASFSLPSASNRLSPNEPGSDDSDVGVYGVHSALRLVDYRSRPWSYSLVILDSPSTLIILRCVRRV